MELTNHLSTDSNYAVCQKCDSTYERYTIFYKDDVATLTQREQVRNDKSLDKLCKDCFVEEMEPHLEFALD